MDEDLERIVRDRDKKWELSETARELIEGVIINCIIDLRQLVEKIRPSLQNPSDTMNLGAMFYATEF
jgi:hypothetical protein